jgi:organic radical activating enzyme
MQVNLQPHEPIQYRHDGILELVNVWQTIQGEGPFAGTPSVFVRLAGCNLECRYCDTDYTTDRYKITDKALVELVQETRPAFVQHDLEGSQPTMKRRIQTLAVITGGEPFRQNIASFCRLLVMDGYRVQIETNGTYFDAEEWTVPRCTIVCSPKTPHLHPEARRRVDHLKYVLDYRAVSPVDGLPTSVLGNGLIPARPWDGFNGETWVQPSDHGDPVLNRLSREAALKSCYQYGYRLSLQLHKILGEP